MDRLDNILAGYVVTRLFGGGAGHHFSSGIKHTPLSLIIFLLTFAMIRET